MELDKLEQKELIKFIKNKISNNAIRKAEMQQSIDYYDYRHEILNKRRLAIGEGGKVIEIHNLPNSRLLDNQFARVVDQKVNYLFSLPPIVESENEGYQEKIQELYNKRFVRTLNKIALESYLCGISWLYVFVDKGEFKYKMIDSREIIPIWSDNNHESLDAIIRNYSIDVIEDGEIKRKNRIAFYTDKEYSLFEVDNGEYELIEKNAYMINENGDGLAFTKIPFVYFKSNSRETPILNRCKSLQDGINTILSNYQDNMLEDKRNTIMVIKNYDGENLGEFRQNLSTYGAVKVRTADGTEGGVEALEIQVNSENYKTILILLRDKLIENLRGIDGKNAKDSNTPNELNLKTMYSNIELDANAIELEFTASLEHLEWFFKKANGISDDDISEIAFKRNIMINEESQVNMIRNSVGILSKETLIANHPFVTDVSGELERVDTERESDFNAFNDYPGLDDELIGGGY